MRGTLAVATSTLSLGRAATPAQVQCPAAPCSAQELGALVGQGAQEVCQLLVANSGGQQVAAQHLPRRGSLPRVCVRHPLDQACDLHDR